MGISVFPEPAGAAATNDFILDKANTTNNAFELGRSFEAGGYSVTVTGSTAYDIYLLDANGSSVGYTNTNSINASAAFESVSALGLGTADIVSFTYNGPSSDATASGTETGAGAYLTSITPSDLPQIDDTAIVAGGNFASDVQITFTSGTVELSAKNVVVGSSTALVVTRPDGLIEDLAPYDLVAVNPGVTPPSATSANVLAGTVTAGTDPSFVTTSPIFGAFTATAFSTSILTSDSEGTVVDWQVTAGTVPTGLTLATATGVLSGTPTADGDYFFTVQITDDGGNTNSQEFRMPVGSIISASNSTVVSGTAYYWFTASNDFEALNLPGTANFEYVVIAGGGSGGNGLINQLGGGGGAGGVLHGTASITDGGDTYAMVVGAGAAQNSESNGNDSYWTGIATATGGGRGGKAFTYDGANGGSGGGASTVGAVGTGISGQGFNGGTGTGSNASSGGGGGAGEAGNTDGQSAGGDGTNAFSAWASAIGIVFDGGYYGGGGGGGSSGSQGSGGLGGGGRGSSGGAFGESAAANSGGGGGGATRNSNDAQGFGGGSGLIIIKEA